MEERQKMCIYYESSTRWSFEYYCKSPGNSYPSDARQKERTVSETCVAVRMIMAGSVSVRGLSNQ